MQLLWMQFHWINLSKKRDVILNRAKDYYENDKERLRKQARDKYKNLSKEEKNKKRERVWKKHIPQLVWKKRLKEYQKSYCEAIKSQYNNKWNSFLIKI